MLKFKASRSKCCGKLALVSSAQDRYPHDVSGLQLSDTLPQSGEVTRSHPNTLERQDHIAAHYKSLIFDRGCLKTTPQTEALSK